MYEFDSRIRYSEIGRDGRLSLVSLLDYFQDCSTFHSEDIGVGLKYLVDRHLCWVMSAWQIVVKRYPLLGERVKVCTAPYDFKGFLGYRNFMLKTQDGEMLACANTLWTLMDMMNMRPVRAEDNMVAAYVLEERLDMEYAPRKIAVPKTGREQGEVIEVKKHHLDTNNHVNNGQYVRMAMDSLSNEFEIKQMRAEYKKQALLGDIIVPEIYEGVDKKHTVVLNTQEKEPYCIVEFEEN